MENNFINLPTNLLLEALEMYQHSTQTSQRSRQILFLILLPSFFLSPILSYSNDSPRTNLKQRKKKEKKIKITHNTFFPINSHIPSKPSHFLTQPFESTFQLRFSLNFSLRKYFFNFISIFNSMFDLRIIICCDCIRTSIFDSFFRCSFEWGGTGFYQLLSLVHLHRQNCCFGGEIGKSLREYSRCARKWVLKSFSNS